VTVRSSAGDIFWCNIRLSPRLRPFLQRRRPPRAHRGYFGLAERHPRRPYLSLFATLRPLSGSDLRFRADVGWDVLHSECPAREYHDVTPLKGVYHGASSSTLGVTVEVTRLG
jgi:hypothetical protein